MDEGPFSPPVGVITGKQGSVVTQVTSARQAAEVLLYKWPADTTGRKHLAARKACLDVLAGLKQAAVARKALVEAAKESGVLMETPERPTAVKRKR